MRNDLVPGNPQVTFCTRFPPQVAFVPGDARNMPGLQALYPQVQPDIPCGEWRPFATIEATVTPIHGGNNEVLDQRGTGSSEKPVGDNASPQDR
jgi:hypothetical protein